MVDERTWSILNPAAASAEASKTVTDAVILFPDGDLILVVPELARSLGPSAAGALGTLMLHQPGNGRWRRENADTPPSEESTALHQFVRSKKRH